MTLFGLGVFTGVLLSPVVLIAGMAAHQTVERWWHHRQVRRRFTPSRRALARAGFRPGFPPPARTGGRPGHPPRPVGRRSSPPVLRNWIRS